MKMRTLSNKIIEMLLMSLGDDFEKKFEPEFSSSEGYLRINNYSPPEIIEKDVEGLGMHTEIGGLHVRSKEGKWMDIEPCFCGSVGEKGLRGYRPFLCGDYMKFRENREKGKFEKVGFTVLQVLHLCKYLTHSSYISGA
ncbi:putative isopenicillin N synthase [Helianthus annuus]|nr:putative isopenicillin N synthase [Helianthus annuus]